MSVSVSCLLATSSSTKLEDPKRHSDVSILLFEGEVTEESPKLRTVCLQSGLEEQYLSAIVCSCAYIRVLESLWLQELC